MRRLVTQLVIAGVALAAGGTAAGCSGAPGVAYAQGADRATMTMRGEPSPVTATVPASARAKTAPAVSIDVAGGPAGVKAKDGILVDASTGQVLYSKNANVTAPIASITKVMTALVIIRAGGLNREVRVPKGVTSYVVKYGAEAAGLKPGQEFTADQLLHAMLIESAADAAYTLASAYGPGLPAFVAKMNVEAARLGLTQTHFTSPDGLPYPTETSTYSTPAQLVRLGEVAMSNPEFRSIVAMRTYNIARGNGHSAYSFRTDSAFLDNYKGALGIKTGYTDVAGHTLLFEAARDGRTLIGAVLGSPNTSYLAAAQDATKILNWGFTLKQTTQAIEPAP